MPGDAYVRAAAYVPGMGWLPKQESGMPVGTSDPAKRISAIRVNVETAGGAVYGRGYGICYSTKMANANWSSEVCNGATSGVASFSGGTLERLRIRLTTPVGVAANVCYAVSNQQSGWGYETPKCDGGAAPLYISNYKIVQFYLYTAGSASRGPHTRSIWDLTSSQRTTLSTKIQQCVTQRILDTHVQIANDGGHEVGPVLLEAHRNFIWDMEKCLVTSGAGQFVPLPYWNPGDPLPVEARAVKQIGGTYNPPLLRSEVWKSDVDAAKDSRWAPWDLPTFATVEDWADWYFVLWHNAVHGALGGTMDGNHMQVAPAAVSSGCSTPISTTSTASGRTTITS